MAKTIIIASGTASNTATRYQNISGDLLNSSAESDTYTKFRSAGVLSGLNVRISVNSTTANSICRTRKNAANGGQTATILSGQTGLFEDTSGTDSVSSGDNINYQTVPGSAATLTARAQTMLFAATTNTVTRIGITGATGLTYTASTTYYQRLSENHNPLQTTEADRKIRMRKAGTFKNLSVVISASSTQNHVARIRKNGGDSGIAATCLANQTGIFEDTSNTSSCAVDDDFNFSFTTGSVITSLVLRAISCEFETTDNSGFVVVGSNNITYLKTTTNYSAIGGTLALETSETFRQIKAFEAFTFDNLELYISANATDGVPANVYALRTGAADTALVINQTTSAQTGLVQNTTDTATISSGDALSLRITNGDTSGGTRNITITWMAMFYFTSVAGAAIERALATETVTLSESRDRLAAKIRTRTDTAITVGETGTRLAAKMRPISTQTTVLSESIIRVKGKVKTLATETITVTGGTIARLLAKIRTALDTTTISESRQRLGSKSRPLSTQTVALSESLQRIKGKIKTLATETVTVGAGTLARLSTKIRAISLQTIALTDNRTRLKGSMRSLATQTVILSESIARTVARQVIRALATQTVALSESLARLKISQRIISQTTILADNRARLSTKFRALAAQTIIISDFRTRIKSVIKTISQTTILSENISRQLAKIRAIAAQTVALADSVTRQIIGGAIEITRTLSQTVVLSETLGRRLASQRLLSQTVPKAENLARVRGVLRTLSQSIPVSESRSRIKSASRLTSQTTLSSDSITKRMTKIRAITQTIITAENVAQETVGNLVRSMVETITVSDSIVRRTAKLVILDQFVIIAEQASRISAKLRIIPAQTITLSDSATNELNVIIKNIVKVITSTLAITDHAKIEVVKKSQRFRKILQPSIKRLISNHPAWLLGTRGMHNDYEEFSP